MKVFFSFLLIAIGIIIVGSFVIYSAESQAPDSQINSYLDALWWSIATITTVGYGDKIPVTDTGKIFAMVYMILGISTLVVGLSIVSTFFYNKRFKKQQKEISHAQRLILERIDDLEKNQERIQQNLEKNQEKLQNDLRDLIEKFKDSQN